uniref:Ubiquitin-like protease family profile domain-containing protein n=1 Tax=Setaria viridis TaxID=4556 RepID=A0A4U6VHT3_SETVI|nr:hypothetical protein SEVIR_3G228300v2 [Setaria viridis]
MDLNIESPSSVDLDDRPLKNQNYTMSDLDYCAQIAIETSLKSDLLVKVDDISVKQKELLCLLDQSKYVDDDILLPLNIEETCWYLAILNFVEYWTGEILSHAITQEDISQFRLKLAGILLCWKTKTAEMTTKSVQNHGTEKNSNDVVILESQDDGMKSKDLESLSVHEMKSKELESLSDQNKYRSLMSTLSTMSVQELLGGLCDYIKSINCAETLQNIWIQNSKPYSITLTVKKLQEIINEDVPMDHDCLNLIIRKIMFDNIKIVKKTKGTISKHCYYRFWMTPELPELSGYFVSLFMSAWKGEELQLPVLKLRKRILEQLLTYKDNECKYNMPSGVVDYISCICNTQK